MSMGITMQSFMGIRHSIEFWRSAENPPPSPENHPLAAENHPPSAKNHPPSVVNISPQQKILPSSAKIPEIQVQGVFFLKSINNLFLYFSFVRHVHGDHHAKFRGSRT
jgi:hypothetical protein